MLFVHILNKIGTLTVDEKHGILNILPQTSVNIASPSPQISLKYSQNIGAQIVFIVMQYLSLR